MDRLSWIEYFMEIAEATAKRSPCLSRQVGSVLTINNRIVATGYNGPPKGIEHCKDECPRKLLNIESGTHHEKCIALHAEQNIIISCATIGIAIENAVLYCTHFPCHICTKMILNLDINTIFFKEYYPDDLSVKLLKEKEFFLYSHNDISLYTKHNNTNFDMLKKINIKKGGHVGN